MKGMKAIKLVLEYDETDRAVDQHIQMSLKECDWGGEINFMKFFCGIYERFRFFPVHFFTEEQYQRLLKREDLKWRRKGKDKTTSN